ncbi:hypothetical protein PFISCL1PPCAC_27529, partial [Pristionchus fissidentatus]
RLGFVFLFVSLTHAGVHRNHPYKVSRSSRSINDWHCGIGDISGGLSYALAQFTNHTSTFSEINNCCMEHDDLLEMDGLSRQEVDRVFCQCLEDINSVYVNYIVSPLFCHAIKAYTLLFHANK